MKRERCIGERIDQPVLEHVARAVMAFFTRLEHEHDRARKTVSLRREHPRGADQHRDMRVMPAGMHRAFSGRGIIEPGFLIERQRIHIPAQQHRAAIVRSAQDRDQPGGRGPLAQFERQAIERRLDLGERLGVVKPEFRLDMDRATQGHEVGKDFVSLFDPGCA